MDDELQLISDGDGLAVIGEEAAVERFLDSEGLLTQAVAMPRLGTVIGAGAAVAQAGSQIAASSGRWVKLTKDSARLVREHGLRQSSKSGLSTGVVRGSKGQIKAFVEFVNGPGSFLTNPARLSAAAGLMAQLAMQQTMDEITDYLATIDQKVDDVLRAQKDAVLARMIGAGLVIDEAMTTRQHGGRVNEVTWSKVQAAPATIAETQAYALRRLDALAEKLERETRIGELADAAKDAESQAREWLAVLARSFQLQDAIAVIELDRVLDAAPGDLDGHRLGLKAARQDRLALITRSTERLMARLDAAASRANAKVLLHPVKSRDVVHTSNRVALVVRDFHGRLGIAGDRESLEARRWADAANEVRSKVLETGADGADAARRLGNESFDRARSATSRLSTRINARPLRRRGDEPERDADER